MKTIILFLLAFCILMSFFGTTSASQQNEIKFTILYDNYDAQVGLEPDWGFSCLIEGTEKTILFDTGTNGDLLLRNAKALNADLNSVELVVISHDHGDHTGGLVSFLKIKSDLPVYLLTSFRDALFKEVEKTGAKTVGVKEPIQICTNVHTTGEMGVQIKEQALILDTSQGIVVITGCAHPGIVGIVKRAKELMNKDIDLVFGGFHLMQTPTAQIKGILAEFRSLGVKKVGATHCTGDEATEMFREEWGKNFVELGVGRKFSISK